MRVYVDPFADGDDLNATELNKRIAKMNMALQNISASNFNPNTRFDVGQVPDALPKNGGVLTGPVRTKNNVKIDGVNISTLKSIIEQLQATMLGATTALYTVQLDVEPGGQSGASPESDSGSDAGIDNYTIVADESVVAANGKMLQFMAPDGYSGHDAVILPSFTGLSVPYDAALSIDRWSKWGDPIRSDDHVIMVPETKYSWVSMEPGEVIDVEGDFSGDINEHNRVGISEPTEAYSMYWQFSILWLRKGL